MGVVQVSRFSLGPDVDEAQWLAVDRTAQAVAHGQPGLLRRTTARADDRWLVVELWRSDADADARAPDPALALVDPSTLTVERYHDLD